MSSSLQVGDRVGNIGPSERNGVVRERPDGEHGRWVVEGEDGAVWTCSDIFDFTSEAGVARHAYSQDIRKLR